MITIERLGIRQDGNPVVETSTYVPVAPDHPLAVTLEGQEGYWARMAVGNSFTAIGARSASRQEFEAAKQDINEKAEAIRIEVQARHEQMKAELDAKKDDVRKELSKLGLSQTTIKAILDQVRGG